MHEALAESVPTVLLRTGRMTRWLRGDCVGFVWYAALDLDILLLSNRILPSYLVVGWIVQLRLINVGVRWKRCFLLAHLRDMCSPADNIRASRA
jgi:hypothetical protein